MCRMGAELGRSMGAAAALVASLKFLFLTRALVC